MAGETSLDLCRLDPMPADLHLGVVACDELEEPVGPPPANVPRAIHPLTRPGQERIGEEPRGGQVGPMVVADRQLGSADEEFSHRSHGDRATAGIEDIAPDVVERAADRRHLRSLAPSAHPGGGPHRRLGGTVDVDQFSV